MSDYVTFDCQEFDMYDEKDPELIRQKFHSLKYETASFTCFDYTNDENLIACSSNDLKIHVFEIETNKKIYTFDVQEPDMTKITSV